MDNSNPKDSASSDEDSNVLSSSTIYNAGMDESTQQLNEKCGEIFVEKIYDSEVFSFTCVFCDKVTFTEISDFFEHFKNIHTKSFVVTQKFDPLELNYDRNEKIINIEDNIYQTDWNEEFETEIKDSNELETYSDNLGNSIEITRLQIFSSGINKNGMENKVKPKFPCEMCGKKYLLESSLRRHIRLVHKKVDSGCAKNSTQHSKVSTHKSLKPKQSDEKLCTDNDSNREDDDECVFIKSFTNINHSDDESDDKSRLGISNTNVHNDDLINMPKTDRNKVFVCMICNKNYLLQSSLHRHMKNIHMLSECVSTELLSDNEGKNVDFEEYQENVAAMKYTDPMKCGYCGLLVKGKAKRIEHERIHTGERPFKCKLCEKYFRTALCLKKHELTHSGVKPHKCHMCNAAFTEKTNLHRHIRRHIGDKKLPCQYCGKLFQEKSDRDIHERRHTGEKPFQCSECGKCYTTRELLRRHSLRHTNDRRFNCELCEKRFYSNRDLMEHMVAHTGERPFKCDICNASFPRQKSLKSHKKLHSEDAEYLCTICGKGFKQRPGLYCHMKRHGILAKS